MKEYLRIIDEVIERGKYKDTWESLQQYKVPEWYEKAKFGIFIHWGVYSVPAFGNEWYSRNMYMQGTPEFEHLESQDEKNGNFPPFSKVFHYMSAVVNSSRRLSDFHIFSTPPYAIFRRQSGLQTLHPTSVSP